MTGAGRRQMTRRCELDARRRGRRGRGGMRREAVMEMWLGERSSEVQSGRGGRRRKRVVEVGISWSWGSNGSLDEFYEVDDFGGRPLFLLALVLLVPFSNHPPPWFRCLYLSLLPHAGMSTSLPHSVAFCHSLPLSLWLFLSVCLYSPCLNYCFFITATSLRRKPVTSTDRARLS